MKDTCKQTSQHRRAPRVELICIGRDQSKTRIRIFQHAIGTVKQAGDYNKITTYLILHIRKTYKHSGDITDVIEKQEPFNFKPSAPRLKILSIVETVETSPEEKLEIKHENDQYKIKYKAELQLHLK